MNRNAIIVLTVAAFLAATPIDAHAQMSFGSFKGYLTGHVGMIAGDELTNENFAAGGSVAVVEQTGWGAEFDFGHSSDAVAGPQVLDVTSYLMNAIWVKPLGVVRPFAIGGAGVLQVNGCDTPCYASARTYDLAMNLGGGAIVAFNDIVGIRADARYFFSSADHPDLHRPDNFSFWRFTVGATFMWSINP
ncbi:MAG TPA: outer membrane beta-barrel protein [Vicinamibacterales bacterium]